MTLKALSLFSGAGGLDLGLEEAGWSILGQVEFEADAAQTLRQRGHNSGHEPVVIENAIENVDSRRLRRNFGLRRGELDLLAGGPPCQPFTTSGLRRALHDRRASALFPAYLDFVSEFQPKALLIENVDGMLSAALRHRPLTERGGRNRPLERDEMKGSFLQWFLGELAEQGYALSWGVAEAADYGVPQMRQRSIVIGVRGTHPCYLPPAEFGPDPLLPVRTVKDALASVGELGPVQPLSARKRSVYELIPPGGNWRDLPIEVQEQTMGAAYFADGGKSGWWRRLDWERASPTILGMPDHSSTALVHPDETRCLSVNECAALQSFPPGSRFAGKPRSQYQQVGNAVPPLLGAALGKRVADAIGGTRFEVPTPPQPRKTSANRRVGTHGWARSDRGSISKVELLVKVRPDHVWALLI